MAAPEDEGPRRPAGEEERRSSDEQEPAREQEHEHRAHRSLDEEVHRGGHAHREQPGRVVLLRGAPGGVGGEREPQRHGGVHHGEAGVLHPAEGGGGEEGGHHAAFLAVHAPPQSQDQQDHRDPGQRRGKPGGEQVGAEDGVGGPLRPVEERGLVPVGDVVERGGEPLALGLHLRARPQVPGLVGMGAGRRVAERGQVQGDQQGEQGGAAHRPGKHSRAARGGGADLGTARRTGPAAESRRARGRRPAGAVHPSPACGSRRPRGRRSRPVGPGRWSGADSREALDRAEEADLDARLAELVSPGPTELPARGAGAPLLARAVERIALLVNAGAAPSVTVGLGRSLDVRIDQARAGVEVTIRAVHGLSPLAEAELPRLVAALRARGVRVSRAGVLARPERGRRSLTPRRSSATTAANDGSVAKW